MVGVFLNFDQSIQVISKQSILFIFEKSDNFRKEKQMLSVQHILFILNGEIYQ